MRIDQNDPKGSWLIADMEFPDPKLGVRIKNILRQNGILTLGELMQHSEEEIGDLRNFGTKCVAVLREKLASYGLEMERERHQW